MKTEMEKKNAASSDRRCGIEKINYVGQLLRREPILTISGILAAVSCLAVPPGAEYLNYINWRTIVLLFCMMGIVAGAADAGIFRLICRKITAGISDQRRLSLALVLLCFFFSMFITNDVTLVTVVPVTLLLMEQADEKSLILTLVQETIAANLGSMFTPFGNPQNLYLSSFYQVETGRFLALMLPYTLLSLGLLMLQTARIGKLPLSGKREDLPENEKTLRREMIFYGCLFAIAVLSVVRLLNEWVLLLVVLTAIGLHDRPAFRKVNYSLLVTFVFFFVLIGNLGQIPAIRNAILTMLRGHELGISVLASQVVSNVPAAILLSGFTDKAEALIVGTNIGGLGTLIASMASIITFQLYVRRRGAQTGRYFRTFTVWNCVDLAALLLLAWILSSIYGRL